MNADKAVFVFYPLFSDFIRVQECFFGEFNA